MTYTETTTDKGQPVVVISGDYNSIFFPKEIVEIKKGIYIPYSGHYDELKITCGNLVSTIYIKRKL